MKTKVIFDAQEIEKILTKHIELEFQRKVTDFQVNIKTYTDERSGIVTGTGLLDNVVLTLGDKIVQKYGAYDR